MIFSFLKTKIIEILAVLLALSFLFGAYSHLKKEYYKSKIDTIESKFKAEKALSEKRHAEDLAKKQSEINGLYLEFENAKAEKVSKIKSSKDTVERVIERTVYRNVCVDDDGLHELNRAIKTSNS